MSASERGGALRYALQRAEAHLSAHGSGLQQALAAALLLQRPPGPAARGRLLAGQHTDGAWAAFWSFDVSSVDATAYRLTQALAVGLAPGAQASLARAIAWLAARQGDNGRWQEDEALAEVAPPWAQPRGEAATLYLTANAGWVMARCGETAPAAAAARALAERLDAAGGLPSFAQTQWLAAGLWLLRGDTSLAARSLCAIEVDLPNASASQLVWLLNCLLDSGLERDHPIIESASVRLCAEQAADGSWRSDDGDSFAPQVTLEGLRALLLLTR